MLLTDAGEHWSRRVKPALFVADFEKEREKSLLVSEA
jgi:hypothetical protein